MLDKIYKEEYKFSGISDNFNFKVKIFYDECKQLGLPPNTYIYDTSIMLSGQAQTHYYANCGNISTFDQFCSNMQFWLRALSGDFLIWLNGRHLALLISSPQIPLYLQLNAFESFVLSIIPYSEVLILHITALYTFVKTSFEPVEVMLFLLLASPTLF